MENKIYFSKLKDVLLLLATLFLFIVNPLFHILKDIYTIIFALMVVSFYFTNKNIEKSPWKIKFLQDFFEFFNNPRKLDFIIGMTIILFGKYLAIYLKFQNTEMFLVVFFVYYVIKSVYKSITKN